MIVTACVKKRTKAEDSAAALLTKNNCKSHSKNLFLDFEKRCKNVTVLMAA